MESVPDAVFCLDENGRLIYFAPGWQRTLGRDPAVDQGRPLEDLTHPDDRVLVQGFLARALGSPGDGAEVEHRLPGPDGSWRWFATSARIMPGPPGQPLRLACAARDVTSNRRMADALEDVEKQLADMIAFLPDPTYVIDRDGRVLAWNRAMAELSGIRAEDILGKSGYAHAVPFFGEPRPMLADLALHRDPDAETVYLSLDETEKGLTAESHHPELGLGGVYLASTAVVLLDGEGRPNGAIESIRDVSRVKEAEARLKESEEKYRLLAKDHRRAREEAEAANRAKSDFLAVMSHEIRTPLGGVSGMAELLLGTSLTDRQRTYARTALESANALLAVIDEILDFSRIEAGRMQLESAPFDLYQVIEETGRMLAGGAAAKGLELAVMCLPGRPRRLVGDAARLRQVVLNLAGNAVKFTSEGFVRIDVGSREMGPGVGRVIVRVEDSGIGVSPEAKEKIFEKFTQADAGINRKFGGTGLGLAVCSRLIGLMGGRIGHEDRPGGGSVFFFALDLPLADDGRPVVSDGLNRSPLPRVLVVSDGAVGRGVLARQASAFGCPVQEAGLGEDALRILAEAEEVGRPFDIVLAAHMPDMSVGVLAERIVQQHGDRRPALAELVSLNAVHENGGVAGSIEAVVYQPVPLDRLAEVLDGLRPGVPLARAVPDVGDFGPVFSGRVLLVEDNPANQLAARSMLEGFGLDVDVAENGAEAVDLADKYAYDLVFMDGSMPVMDGFEATRRIRALKSPTAQAPILAMTASVLPEDRQRCIEAGMDDYLIKPVRRKALGAVLAERLGGAGATRPDEVDEDSSPADAGEETVLDPGVVRDTFGEDDRTIRQFMAIFLEDTPAQVKALMEAVSHADPDTVRAAAHRVKGGAAEAGGLRLARVAGRIEAAAVGGRMAEARQLAPDVQKEFDLLKTEIGRVGWDASDPNGGGR